MGYLTALILGLLFTGAPQGSQRGAATPYMPFAEARMELKAQCAQGRFSGVVLLRRADAPAWRHHCGQGVQPDSRFKVFSVSKQFTAAVIMAHVEAGRIELEGAVTDYLDTAPASWRDVSVLELLRHQSGLPDLTNQLFDRYLGGERDHASAVNAVLADSMDVVPELEPDWRYNNFGYELLTLVAEAVDQRSFETQLTDLVFEPAGMSSAVVERAAAHAAALRSLPDPALAPGFNGGPQALEPATSHSFVQRGAGALHLSAQDMAAYLGAYRAGQVLSAGTVSRMTGTLYRRSEATSVGLGWFVSTRDGVRMISHSGGTNGYVALMAFFPDEDVELVVASNYGFADLSALIDAVVRDILTPTGDGQ